MTMAATLYVKAGPDGKSLGDCPFSHKAILMITAKDYDHLIKPVDSENKPDWYVELNENGTFPTLVEGQTVIKDSEEILQHLEMMKPVPRLLNTDSKIKDVVSPILPGFANILKNKDKDKEPELFKNLEDAVEKLNTHLENTSGGYLAGNQMTTMDFDLAPKLYHAKFALKEYKNYEIPEKFAAVRSYMDRMFNSEVFQKHVYPPEVVVWGWSKFQ